MLSDYRAVTTAAELPVVLRWLLHVVALRVLA